MTDTTKLEHLAYILKDLTSLRNLFAELNFNFANEPVNKEDWSESEKEIVKEANIIAKKDDYLIYYLQTNTDSFKRWKDVAAKIIKQNHGLCLVCSHNPAGFQWVFSNLSSQFSKSFNETRHIPLEVRPDIGVPKPCLEFLASIKVEDDEKGISILKKISDAFDEFSYQIHDELTINVFDALESISKGLIEDKSNKLSLTNETLEEIRGTIFILLYRIIFTLYAEDRTIFLVDGEVGVYYEKFSLKWLKRHWILQTDNVKKLNEYDVQNRLKGLFHLIEEGSESLGYSPDEFFMMSYYGKLFDRKIHSNLEKWKIPNKYLLEALDLLTRTKDRKGKYFLDYAALEIRHLGDIYQHLLGYHVTVEGKKIAKLPSPKQRKITGSYYTPDDIVDYIIKNTLEPIIQKIIQCFPVESDQIEKLQSLKILDPTMGSGHFLVRIVRYLAKRICEIEFPDGKFDEEQFNYRKREVLRRCIYGVDFNPLAVDLAKLSLWLETLSSEKPLSFLSAHMKTGNSVLGANISEIFDAQQSLLETESKKFFKKTVKDFLGFESLEDDTSSAVKAKLEKYSKMLSPGTIYYQLKVLLDIQTAKSFGIEVSEWRDLRTKVGVESESLDYYSSKSGPTVKEASDKHAFFHWELEFPEIFFDANGESKDDVGFDIIIGNPPYVEKNDVDYPIRNFQTESCGNIYSYVLENSIKFLKKGGRVGMIFPLSAFCTQRMQPMMELIEKNANKIYVSHYGWRPSKLFPSVNRAISILLLEKKETDEEVSQIYTTTCNKWYTRPVDERPELFKNLRYQKIPKKNIPFIIPKIGTKIEEQILSKIYLSKKHLGDFFSANKTNFKIFYRTTGGLYWKIITDFQPKFFEGGKVSHSSRESNIYFENEEWQKLALALYNSNLFWWFYTINGNGRDLNPYDLKSLPIDLEKIKPNVKTNLKRLVSLLMKDLNKNAIFAIRKHKNKKPVKYQKISPKKSKKIIDEIDKQIAQIYDFTDEETEFIINYDGRFRMGDEAEEE